MHNLCDGSPATRELDVIAALGTKSPHPHNVFVLHASEALHPPHPLPPPLVFVPTEKMHNDDDKAIRRKVHNVLTHYRKTGKWNIL